MTVTDEVGLTTGPAKRSMNRLSTDGLQETGRRSSDMCSIPQPECLVILHVTTAGKQGEEMGCDEYPTVLLTAKLFDFSDPESHSAEFQSFIRPCCRYLTESISTPTESGLPNRLNLKVDVHGTHKLAGSVLDETDNDHTSSQVLLTEECKAATGLTDEMLADAGTLRDALDQFQKWLDDQKLVWRINQSTDSKRKLQQADYNQSSSVTDENRSLDESLPKKALVSDAHCHTQNRRQARTFALLTDGPLGIRLVLHPEATAKSIDLSSFPFMYQYLDVRTIFRQLYQLDYTPGNLSEMLARAGITCETSEREFRFRDNDLNVDDCWSGVSCTRTSQNQDTTSQNEVQLSEMEVDSDLGIDAIRFNQTTQLHEMDTDATREGVTLCQPDILLSPSPPTTPGYLPIKHCRNVAKLVAHMHEKGAHWNETHLITEQYEPAIVRKTETVDDNLVVRARGLPWQATDMDIARFFSGLNIAPGGISLVLSDIGRRNGEALVQFTQPDQRDLALRKHKHHMGQRYIEVYAANGRDFVAFAGVETTEAEEFLKRFTSLDQALIRMRGLPYTATEADILQFFANANCPIQYGEAGVLFVNRRSGQATGDAFVMFETQALAAEALKSHRQHIGNRYIELFKSTPAEVNQVVNTALNLSPTLPPIRNCVKLDVESALSAAAALAVGASVDINEGAPSNANLNHVLEPTAAVASQAYNPGYPLFGSTSLSQLMQTNGLYMSPMIPACPQLGTQPSEPMFNADNFSLYRTTTQFNPALFPGGATLVAPHPFAPKLSTNFTAAYPSYNSYPSVTLPGGACSVPLTSAQPTLNYNWYSPYAAGGSYNIFTTMEQFARSFIRIRGLPFDADITDILIFLEDHRYSVALHGVHQVYSPLGLPTGEAIIQLLSEFVAQHVVQQKHGSLFVRPGYAGPACIVEVNQCNVEDLRQLLATMLAIVQANVENEYLPALNSHILQASIPDMRSIFPHTHPYLASHLHLSSPMVAPANQINPVLLSSGLQTASSHNPTLMVPMMDRRIQPSDTQSTIASHFPTTTIKSTNSIMATEQTKHHSQQAQGGAISYASVMSHLICQPPQTLLNNVLPTGALASSFIPLTPSGAELFGHLKSSIQPLNVFGQPGVNLVNSATVTQGFLKTTRKDDLQPTEVENHSNTVKHKERGIVMESKRIANITRHRQTVPTPHSEKLLERYSADEESKVIVYLKGLPKDVSCNEITSLFIEHDVKPFSIRLDYTEDGLATGNASVHLCKRSDAEYLVNHVGKLWLREHQVNVNMEGPRQGSS